MNHTQSVTFPTRADETRKLGDCRSCAIWKVLSVLIAEAIGIF